MRITQILEKGNCGNVRERGEKACIKAVGLQIETAYKAVSSGRVAQHIEALSLEYPVNAGMVQLEFAFLSGETLEEQSDQRVSRRYSTLQAGTGRPELNQAIRNRRFTAYHNDPE
jgi:hypothetical protein